MHNFTRCIERALIAVVYFEKIFENFTQHLRVDSNFAPWLVFAHGEVMPSKISKMPSASAFVSAFENISLGIEKSLFSIILLNRFEQAAGKKWNTAMKRWTIALSPRFLLSAS